MDITTGKIYKSKEEALEAGVSEDNLITGTKKALRKIKKLIPRLSQKARTKIYHQRKRKLKTQKESRRRNR